MQENATAESGRETLTQGMQSDVGFVVNHANHLDAAMLAARRSAPPDQEEAWTQAQCQRLPCAKPYVPTKSPVGGWYARVAGDIVRTGRRGPAGNLALCWYR